LRKQRRRGNTRSTAIKCREENFQIATIADIQGKWSLDPEAANNGAKSFPRDGKGKNYRQPKKQRNFRTGMR